MTEELEWILISNCQHFSTDFVNNLYWNRLRDNLGLFIVTYGDEVIKTESYTLDLLRQIDPNQVNELLISVIDAAGHYIYLPHHCVYVWGPSALPLINKHTATCFIQG